MSWLVYLKQIQPDGGEAFRGIGKTEQGVFAITGLSGHRNNGNGATNETHGEANVKRRSMKKGEVLKILHSGLPSHWI